MCAEYQTRVTVNCHRTTGMHMNWIERWRSLSARIDGFLSAANFVAQCLQAQSVLAAGVPQWLRAEIDSISVEFQRLHDTCSSMMPPEAASALADYLANPPIWSAQGGFDPVTVQGLAPLFMFRNRFEYLIRDSEIEAKNLTELAFEHLNRLIVASAETKNMWAAAFKKGEIACERLGAVHLLSHGIWAFKVQARGGATDLVYNEPLFRDVSPLSKVSRAIVLTEWKLARDANQLQRVAKIGRTQAADYAGGVLGDLELKHIRYIVLVGRPKVPPPDDVVVGNVVYRHVYISVDPEAPSVRARAPARGRPAHHRAS